MDLNSRTQGTFFISSRKRKRSSGREEEAAAEELRRRKKQEGYETSWRIVEGRIEKSLSSLNSKTLSSVISFVRSSHPKDAFFSPFPAIPTALISGSSMSTASGLLSSLFADLDTKEKDEEYTKVRVDCRPTSNLDSIVRSIVIGLLEGQKEVDFTVDPPTLPTLFGHLPSSPSPPILLIALHQTHLLPTPLLPQLVHVLNRYTAKFVLVLTTAAAGSSTSSTGMEGLDTRSFELPNGSEVWEAVVEAVWFPLSGDREEEVFVGVDGDTLEELRVGFERVEGSLEGLISQIQYIHLKTLSLSRLSLLSSSHSSLLTPLPPTLHHSLLSLPSVTHHARNPSLLHSLLPDAPASSLPPPDQIAALVPAAREEFKKHWKGLGVGYHLLRCLKVFLNERKEAAGAGEAGGSKGWKGRLMRDVLRGERGVGRLGNEETGWRWAVRLASKLPDSEALDLAEQLGLVLEKFEGEDGEVDALANALAEAAVSTEGGAKLVGVGLERFFGARFITPEKILFHEIFYFHHLDDLIRVFHPSPLEAIQTALLSPHTYLGCACCCFSPNASFNNNNNPSHLLPDTTILFLRYLESGKLINLYDWFESFASVLEAVENRNEIEEGGGEKGKKKRKKAEEGGQLVGGGREEAQARFMRAFHELDFLGLLKGTKRREDCCLKTLFRLPEEEEEED